MTVLVSPMPNAFAGEVSAIDCAKPLDGRDIDAIHKGMAKHAVLVFHDQPLTDEQQLAFTKRFGDIERYETPGHIRKRGEERLGSGVADFSNLTRNGSLMTPDNRIWLFKLGDRLWHSDSSFRPITAGYSLLSGRTIPARGGETEFADMRAAYDALDDETKAEIEDLVCEHSLIYSREAIAFFDLTPEERDHFQPVRHRLVRVDARTGRKSLFLSAHAGASQRFMPGIRMRRKGDVRHCQGTIVADWVAISADGQERMSGINVFVMGPGGRIDTVTGLMNLPPSQ